MTKPTPVSAPAATDALPTLASLTAMLPHPPAGALNAIVEAHTRASFVADGAKIASGRIVTDARRVYALAVLWWKSADATQRDALAGITPEFLAVAIEQAVKLEAHVEQHHDGAAHKGAAHADHQRAFDQSWSQAMVLREQALTALLGVCGADELLRGRVRDSAGVATDGPTLARALEAMATLAHELLSAKKGTPLATRVALRGLKPALVDKLQAHAKTVRETSDAATRATSTKTITQADADFLDGINLYFLGETLRAFEAAHDAEPTVPRLVPIATRRLLGTHTRRGGAHNPTSTPGTPGVDAAKPPPAAAP